MDKVLRRMGISQCKTYDKLRQDDILPEGFDEHELLIKLFFFFSFFSC